MSSANSFGRSVVKSHRAEFPQIYIRFAFTDGTDGKQVNYVRRNVVFSCKEPDLPWTQFEFSKPYGRKIKYTIISHLGKHLKIHHSLFVISLSNYVVPISNLRLHILSFFFNISLIVKISVLKTST